MPNNIIGEDVKCNGLSKDNIKFQNPFNKETDIINKLNYDCVYELYMNKEIDHKFNMPDRLKKISYKRNNEDILNKIPMFSIHSSEMTRELFKTDFTSRLSAAFPYTVPHGYIF